MDEFDRILNAHEGGIKWDLTQDICTRSHHDVWAGYHLLGIKKHPRGLVIIAKLMHMGRDDIDVSVGTNPMKGWERGREIPFWITCNIDDKSTKSRFIDLAQALPDACFPTMEPELSLDEILSFQEMVKNGV